MNSDHPDSNQSETPSEKTSRINKASTSAINKFRASDQYEIIKSLNPLFLVIAGGFIAVVALASPNITDEKLISALGLAGTAVSGAAGLAQSTSASNSEPKK